MITPLPHQIVDCSPQRPECKTRPLSEIWLGHDVKITRDEIDAAAIEQAYRRGYHQGYYRGSEDQRHHPKHAIDAFFDLKLAKWRYRTPLEYVEPPELST